MMTEWLSEAAKQVPSLVVMGWIVITFLRHMAKRDETIQALADQCHAVQREGHAVIKESMREMGEVKEAIHAFSIRERTKQGE